MKLSIAACQEVSIIGAFLFDRQMCDDYYENIIEDAKFRMKLWMSSTTELEGFRRKLKKEIRKMMESQSTMSSQGDSWSMPEDIGGD
jgi:hypothetical protein